MKRKKGKGRRKRGRGDEGRTLEELEASRTIHPSFHGQSAGEGLILKEVESAR